MKIPRLMGIVNLTDDSFYPDSRYSDINGFLNAMTDADIIDIGAESTRPYSQPVPGQIQMDKIIPAITAIKKKAPNKEISVDTSEPLVMSEAIKAGATIINDIRSLTKPGALEIIAESKVIVCLTHMQGSPENMQNNPCYPKGVINTILEWGHENFERCLKAGIQQEKILIDPGFGFGKKIEHNWTILKNLELITKEFPTVIGVSNKSMFKNIPGCEEVTARNIPSRIAEAIAAMKNTCIIRTHNPTETKIAIVVAKYQGV